MQHDPIRPRDPLPVPAQDDKPQVPAAEFIQTYFQRLGLPLPVTQPACSRALLNTLQYAHVTRIPYENLDILDGKPLPMTCDEQYQKMVLHRRGGYCFELNGIYAALLQAIGYQVKTCMGRFLRGESTIPMRRHRVILATCSEGTFICDAGVGQQAPRHPLLLAPDLIQEQYGETYQVTREPFFGYVIQTRHKGSWRPMYSFTEEEQLYVDFVMPSYYCEHAPDSFFNKGMMLSIKTHDGRKTIDGNLFRIFRGDDVCETVISEPEQLIALLDESFNLEKPSLEQARIFLAAGSVRR